MKRSAWLKNNQDHGPNRIEHLVEQILSEIVYYPDGINLKQADNIRNVLESNQEFFDSSLKTSLAKCLTKISKVSDEISIYSDYPCYDFFVLQLMKIGPKLFTLTVIFHPGPHSINCISTFTINADNPKLLEVSKVKGFMQDNDTNRFS